MTQLAVLWDESHIWGILVVRAARTMGLPLRLVRSGDIAGGFLEHTPPAMLLVPGGNARHKAESLGPQGLEAIRAYVAGGGQYLGFCGGAGLALSWPGPDRPEQRKTQGLGLCPWKRAGFDDRMQHFMSGHLHMALPKTAPGHSRMIPDTLPDSPSLPVWWPGRFEREETNGISILATYEKPGDDFWLADLPIASLPPDTFSIWRDLYGFSITPTFLAGQPCVIHGTFGQGAYTLSYSHLETPASPHANHWLAHIFKAQAGLAPTVDILPPWRLNDGAPESSAQVQWQDPRLDSMVGLLHQVLQTGLEHGLLFARNNWLMGWRTGIPGANLNNLRAALDAARGAPPGAASEKFWRGRREQTLEAMRLFHKGCIQYLLAERLAMTLAKSLPEVISPELLKRQRASLFGPPMHAGGLYRDIMEPLDELACLQLA